MVQHLEVIVCPHSVVISQTLRDKENLEIVLELIPYWGLLVPSSVVLTTPAGESNLKKGERLPET